MAEWIDYFRGLSKNSARRSSGAMHNDYMAFWDVESNPQEPLLKMAMGLLKDENNTYTIPGIVLGAGDSQGKNRAYIEKNSQGLDIFLRSSEDNVARVRLGNDGKVYVNETEFQVFGEDSKIPSEYISEAEAWNKKLSGLSYDSNTDFWYIPQTKISPELSQKVDKGAEVFSYFNEYGNLHYNRIAAACITTEKLADFSVGTQQLADLSIEAWKLRTASVTSTKIAAAAVGSAAIAAAAIGTAHIANGAILNANIANATITSAKIQSVTADKILTAGLYAERIYNPSNSQNYAKIGGSYADFGLYHYGYSYPWFSIYDSGPPGPAGAFRLTSSSGYITDIMTFDATSINPQGTWNCRYAEFNNIYNGEGYRYITNDEYTSETALSISPETHNHGIPHGTWLRTADGGSVQWSAATLAISPQEHRHYSTEN